MRTLFKDLNPKGAGERFLAGLYLAIRTDRSYRLAGLFLRRPFPRHRFASRLCLERRTLGDGDCRGHYVGHRRRVIAILLPLVI